MQGITLSKLEYLMKDEKQAYATYLKYYKLTGRKEFLNMARDERKHFKILRRLSLL